MFGEDGDGDALSNVTRGSPFGRWFLFDRRKGMSVLHCEFFLQEGSWDCVESRRSRSRAPVPCTCPHAFRPTTRGACRSSLLRVISLIAYNCLHDTCISDRLHVLGTRWWISVVAHTASGLQTPASFLPRPGRAVARVWGLQHPGCRPGLSCRSLALGWPGPGHFSLWRSQPVDSPPFSVYLSNE